MHPESSSEISAAKIHASVALVLIGAYGRYVLRGGDDAAGLISYGLLFLGLWLLVGAWTGRTAWQRTKDFYFKSVQAGVITSAQESSESDLAPTQKAQS
jgi:hypothetical protein